MEAQVQWLRGRAWSAHEKLSFSHCRSACWILTKRVDAQVLGTEDPRQKSALTHDAWRAILTSHLPVGEADPPDEPARPARPKVAALPTHG